MVETADVAWYRPVKAGRLVGTCPITGGAVALGCQGRKKGERRQPSIVRYSNHDNIDIMILK